MHRGIARWAPLAILLVGLAAAPARAWTEANVTSATAHVELSSDGRARVSLELAVRVHGGWLEALEISDLDADLVLDETKPPSLIDVNDPDHKFQPTVGVRPGGRIDLGFRGRGRSPRRGSYLARVVYTTDLSNRATVGAADGHVQIRWTLPGWQAGLDGVTITVSTPPGASPSEAPGEPGDSAVELTTVEAHDRTVFRWRRAHLPRTVPWTVAVDVPEEMMDPSLRHIAPAAPRKMRSVAGDDGPLPLGVAVLAVLLVLMASTQRVVVARACRREGARPRPLLPGPAFGGALLQLGAAVSAVLLWRTEPTAAAGLLMLGAVLGLHRTPRLGNPAALPGARRPITREDLRRSRRAVLLDRLGLRILFDLTTPLGAATALGILFALLELTELPGADDGALLTCLPLLGLPFLTATRHHLPATPELLLHHLLSVARQLRVPATCPTFAMRAEVVVDADGHWQGTSLPLELAETPPGLLRLELTSAEVEELGGIRRVPVLVCVAAENTPAAETFGAELSAEAGFHRDGRRITRLVRLDGDVGDQLTGLLSTLCEPSAEAPTLLPNTTISPAVDREAA